MAEKLVIYDSVFGNTAKVAEAVGKALGPEAKVINVDVLKPQMLDGVKFLIVGSPTRAFRPTEGITAFLKNLSPSALDGVKAAAFDTRIELDDINPKFFRFIIKMGGYADKIIARRLEKAGAELALEPTGFAVVESEGPLKEGELERAAEWAARMGSGE